MFYFLDDEDHKSAIIRENLDTIRSKFACLVLTVSRVFQQKKIDVNSVRLFLCTRLGCKSSDCIPYSESLKEIFEGISRNGLWSYRNYAPIRDVVETFGAEYTELFGHIEAYENALAGFNLATKIVDYVKVNDDIDKEEDVLEKPMKYNRQFYRPLSLKLKLNVTNESLAYVDQLWKKLAKFFLLPSLTALLESIACGSLTVTWLVPCSFIEEITTNSLRSACFFRELGIAMVYVEEEVLYDETLAMVSRCVDYFSCVACYYMS